MQRNTGKKLIARFQNTHLIQFLTSKGKKKLLLLPFSPPLKTNGQNPNKPSFKWKS